MRQQEANERLSRAVRENDFAGVVAAFAHGAEINFTDDSLRTPLHLAAAKAKTSIVRFLIENGAKINAEDVGRNTALHLAVDQSRTNTVRLLIEGGAEIDAPNLGKNTPLHMAAGNGSAHLVRLLVQKGADLDARNLDQHQTPRGLAELFGHTLVVIILKEAADRIRQAAQGLFQTGHNQWIVMVPRETQSSHCR